MHRRHTGIHRSPILFAALLLITGCGSGSDSPTSPSVGLAVPFSTEDLVVGTGPEAMNGDSLVTNFSAWLYDPNAEEHKGAQFDLGPFDFVLGAGEVIAGWDRGVVGMRVGGVRRIVIPPDLAYGAAGSPPRVPGNATLLFEVELVEISEPV